MDFFTALEKLYKAGPVKVDYDKNRVSRSGAATVLIKK